MGGSSLPEGSVRSVRSVGISFLPRMTRINTDGWGALFSHGWHGWTQNLAAWVWQGCHTLLICEHPCHLWEAILCQKVPCVPCVLWEYLFSHGWHGSTQIVRCAVLPQNSQNTQNLAAWVWHGCHTLLICEHPRSSAGGSSLPEGSVRSVRSVGEHRSLVGALETSAPPTE